MEVDGGIMGFHEKASSSLSLLAVEAVKVDSDVTCGTATVRRSLNRTQSELTQITNLPPTLHQGAFLLETTTTTTKQQASADEAAQNQLFVMPLMLPVMESGRKGENDERKSLHF